MNKYVMGTYSRAPITLNKGEGSWVWDKEGKKYLDYTTGIATTNLGHSHTKIINMINTQIQNLIHISNLFNIEPQAKLAKILVENTFADKAFFCNSGTEAVEGAIKLARKWGKDNGNKYKIVCAYGGFHGRTFGALSATGTKKYQDGYEPLLDGFIFVEYGDVEAVKKVVVENEDICAVILEPIQGESGVIVPPDGYLKGVKDICKTNNILIILDEIQVGLGRTGKLFSYEYEGIEPDIMAIAKALGNGVPCGSVLAKEEVARYFTPGSHGTTFGGNPLAMSTAYTVIETIFEEKLLENCVKVGGYFINKLKGLEVKYGDQIAEVRGKGLIIGIQFNDKGFASRCFQKCLDNGLLLILTVENVFRILPPLNTNVEEVDIAYDIISRSIKEVLRDG